MNGRVDEAASSYIASVDARHRPLFDRVHQLVLDAVPEATVTISYDIPTYKAGGKRLYVGVWKHGISLYGWENGRDAGFAQRHPELVSGKGTIRLRAEDADSLEDAQLRGFVRAALSPS